MKRSTNGAGRVTTHSSNISRVIVDANAMLPPRVKYPNGYVGDVFAENLALMERAAKENNCLIEVRPIAPVEQCRRRPPESKFAVYVRQGDCETLVKKFQALQVAQFTSHANAQEEHDEHSNQHQHHTDLCAGRAGSAGDPGGPQ